ncbi:CubicO group peptidase (beta-lactamase class C family) [Pedobacter metabolipauper]|uniref:CubicO group peptidase (Beta-lactamase class C family) n=2 Tax=Pedobacter metabolipauper TaxID=425513 RepID=A0A4R6SPX1_9SPHI|nr:CubicO group peptidase (beta-lactamase class C family) [Pedobacter metabolipauper]
MLSSTYAQVRTPDKLVRTSNKQVRTSNNQAGTVNKIDSVMRLASKRGIFNGNILVAVRGKIIYERSFGYADGGRQRLLSPEMRFDIGSISKEFNGTGIMILKERGLLDLDDPIEKYLPGLPQWSQQVKIRNLINYTSGIPLFAPTATETDSLIWQNLTGLKKLEFDPGTAYIYNHYNVYLQMRIIEKLSGLSYASFIKQNILVPCGMMSSMIDYPADGLKMARAFDSEFRETPYAQGMTGWIRLPIMDLFSWVTNLDSYKIISHESYLELASNFPGGESSLGKTEFQDTQLSSHQHQGSNSNYEALFYNSPKDSIVIVMMTNNQQLKVHGIKSALLGVLNGETVTVPKKSVYLEVREKMLADLQKGLVYYKVLKDHHQDQYDFSFEIGDVISTGKYLQRRKKFNDAISVFKQALMLRAKPQDLSYAYELIAECYLKLDLKELAAANYQKALEMDPNNKNAEGMLAAFKKLD